MGCGTFIMLVLLSFPMDPTSASATSGYQILFSGLSSLAEYFINGEVDLFTSGWFIGLCAVGGGIFTIILYRVLKLASPKTVSIFLYAVIMVLCLMSVALTIVTVAETVSAQGWDSLLGIKFHC